MFVLLLLLTRKIDCSSRMLTYLSSGYTISICFADCEDQTHVTTHYAWKTYALHAAEHMTNYAFSYISELP